MNKLESYVLYKDEEALNKEEVVDTIYHYISKEIKLPKREDVKIFFSDRLRTTGGWTKPSKKEICLSNTILDTPKKLYETLVSAVFQVYFQLCLY